MTLNGAAQSGAFVVPLSSNIAAVTVPASVTIPQGQWSTTFQVTTTAVTADTPGVITAGAKPLSIVLRP